MRRGEGPQPSSSTSGPPKIPTPPTWPMRAIDGTCSPWNVPSYCAATPLASDSSTMPRRPEDAAAAAATRKLETRRNILRGGRAREHAAARGRAASGVGAGRAELKLVAHAVDAGSHAVEMEDACMSSGADREERECEAGGVRAQLCRGPRSDCVGCVAHNILRSARRCASDSPRVILRGRQSTLQGPRRGTARAHSRRARAAGGRRRRSAPSPTSRQHAKPTTATAERIAPSIGDWVNAA